MPVPQYQAAVSSGSSIDDPVAPMPGVIEKIVAEPGTAVEKGDPLVIMIAMKMEVSGNLFVYLYASEIYRFVNKTSILL